MKRALAVLAGALGIAACTAFGADASPQEPTIDAGEHADATAPDDGAPPSPANEGGADAADAADASPRVFSCAGTHVFCEDFEGGELVAWMPRDGDIAPTIVPRSSVGHALRGSIPANVSINGARIRRALGSSAPLTTRFAMRAVEVPLDSTSEFFRVEADANHVFVLAIGPGLVVGFATIVSGVAITRGNFRLTKDEWVVLELDTAFGAEGFGNLRLNGTAVGSGFDYPSNEASPQLIVGPQDTSGAALTLEFDDLVVDAL